MRYVLRTDWRDFPRGKRMIPAYQVPVPSNGPYVLSDISPYNSIVTGEEIGGRRQHREHLREHNCEEVGSETPKWMKERQREQKEMRNG